MDHVLRRLFTILFRLGYFNPLQALPAWASLNNSLVNIPPHQRLALDAARQGLVLLKNAAATLPWDPARIRRLAVVGPSSNITRAMQVCGGRTAPPALVVRGPQCGPSAPGLSLGNVIVFYFLLCTKGGRIGVD